MKLPIGANVTVLCEILQEVNTTIRITRSPGVFPQRSKLVLFAYGTVRFSVNSDARNAVNEFLPGTWPGCNRSRRLTATLPSIFLPSILTMMREVTKRVEREVLPVQTQAVSVPRRPRNDDDVPAIWC
jgi:hypothetical protein